MESMWNPCNSRWIPPIPYGICFGWDLTHFGDSIPPIFHMEWPNSRWIPSVHMEIPDGIYLEYSTIFPVDSTWIPSYSTWNDGITVDSTWIPSYSTWNDGITVDSSWIPQQTIV
jgi:hypothetical protein